MRNGPNDRLGGTLAKAFTREPSDLFCASGALHDSSSSDVWTVFDMVGVCVSPARIILPLESVARRGGLVWFFSWLEQGDRERNGLTGQLRDSFRTGSGGGRPSSYVKACRLRFSGVGANAYR